MPQFQVPQFISEKSKIAGPLTLTQLLFIAGAFGISVLAWAVFNVILWFIVTALVGSSAFALAFVKIEGQELYQVMISALQHWFNPKTYVWQKEGDTDLDKMEIQRLEAVRRSVGLQDKLRQAAMSVSTGITPIFKKKEKGEGVDPEKYQVVTYLTGEQKLAKKIDYKER